MQLTTLAGTMTGNEIEERLPQLSGSRSGKLRVEQRREREVVGYLSNYGANVVSGDRSAAISSSCSKAERRSSTISSAIWSGGGRLAESSMLSSRSQKMSRFTLSRFNRSS